MQHTHRHPDLSNLTFSVLCSACKAQRRQHAWVVRHSPAQLFVSQSGIANRRDAHAAQWPRPTATQSNRTEAASTSEEGFRGLAGDPQRGSGSCDEVACIGTGLDASCVVSGEEGSGASDGSAPCFNCDSIHDNGFLYVFLTLLPLWLMTAYNIVVICSLWHNSKPKCHCTGSTDNPLAGSTLPAASQPGLEQLGAVLLLISPFCFWGTSMVAMKARHCCPRCYGTQGGKIVKTCLPAKPFVHSLCATPWRQVRDSDTHHIL